MDYSLKPYAGYTKGVPYAVLPVKYELLRDDMKYLPVKWYVDRLGVLYHTLYVKLTDLPILYRYHTFAVKTLNMASGDPCVYCIDLNSGHQFRLLHGPLDRFHGRFNINDRSLSESP